MFISPAYAQSGAPGADMSFMFVMLAFMAIFYFLVLRPQQSRADAHKELVNKVRRGDTVVTAGGFIGKVSRVQENSDEVEVELSEHHLHGPNEGKGEKDNENADGICHEDHVHAIQN